MSQTKYSLSDEQAAEVSRRLSEPNPKTLTIKQFRARLRQRLGTPSR